MAPSRRDDDDPARPFASGPSRVPPSLAEPDDDQDFDPPTRADPVREEHPQIIPRSPSIPTRPVPKFRSDAGFDDDANPTMFDPNVPTGGAARVAPTVDPYALGMQPVGDERHTADLSGAAKRATEPTADLGPAARRAFREAQQPVVTSREPEPIPEWNAPRDLSQMPAFSGGRDDQTADIGRITRPLDEELPSLAAARSSVGPARSSAPTTPPLSRATPARSSTPTAAPASRSTPTAAPASRSTPRSAASTTPPASRSSASTTPPASRSSATTTPPASRSSDARSSAPTTPPVSRTSAPMRVPSIPLRPGPSTAPPPSAAPAPRSRPATAPPPSAPASTRSRPPTAPPPLPPVRSKSASAPRPLPPLTPMAPPAFVADNRALMGQLPDATAGIDDSVRTQRWESPGPVPSFSGGNAQAFAPPPAAPPPAAQPFTPPAPAQSFAPAPAQSFAHVQPPVQPYPMHAQPQPVYPVAPMHVVSHMVPDVVREARAAEQNRSAPQVQLRSIAEVTPTPARGMGNLAPPRDPNKARSRRVQDLVIWGSVLVITASLVTLVIWLIAR